MDFYKVYTTYPTYKLFRTETSFEDVMQDLDDLVYRMKQDMFLVIKNNGEYDEVIVRNIEDYLRIKGEMQDVSRRTQKVYRRT